MLCGDVESVLFSKVTLSLWSSGSTLRIRALSLVLSLLLWLSWWWLLFTTSVSLSLLVSLGVVSSPTCFSLLFSIALVRRWTSHCFSAAASNLSATSWLLRSLEHHHSHTWHVWNIFLLTWKLGSCSRDQLQQALERPRRALEGFWDCLRRPPSQD